MEELRCPICKRDFVHRSPIKTTLQRLLSAAHFYPFHCQFCDYRFTAFHLKGLQVQEEDVREYERIPARLPAEIASEGGQTAQAVVTDLSIAGCSLETAAAPSPGELLRLQFQISKDVSPFVVDAAAVRFAGHGKVGLQFLRIREEEKERLRQFVRGLSVARKIG